MALSDSFKLLPRAPWLTGHRAQDLVQRFRQAWRDCVPSRLRRWFGARTAELVVYPDAPEGTRGQLHLQQGDRDEPIGDLPWSGDEPLPGALFARIQQSGHRTRLMVPAELVLVREVSLPAQVQTHLDQVIRYELDRLSPFQPEEVYFAYRAWSPDQSAARVQVSLALVRRDQVRPWVERLAAAGSPVDQLTWDGAWPGANLLGREELPRRRHRLVTLERLLLATLGILLIALIATPIWQKTSFLKEVEREVRRVRAAAITVDEVRQELERARQGSSAVIERKQSDPRMLDLLLELTEQLPDNTWLQTLDYSDGRVEIRGESGQATALIGLLEQAPGIAGVSFSSPVTQVPRTGQERFNIAFRYTPPERR